MSLWANNLLFVFAILAMFGAPPLAWILDRRRYHIFTRATLVLLQGGKRASYSVGGIYEFDGRVRAYWPQSVYLDKMCKEGFLELAPDRSGAYRDWPVYQISAKGRKQLAILTAKH